MAYREFNIIVFAPVPLILSCAQNFFQLNSLFQFITLLLLYQRSLEQITIRFREKVFLPMEELLPEKGKQSCVKGHSETNHNYHRPTELPELIWKLVLDQGSHFMCHVKHDGGQFTSYLDKIHNEG